MIGFLRYYFFGYLKGISVSGRTEIARKGQKNSISKMLASKIIYAASFFGFTFFCNEKKVKLGSMYYLTIEMIFIQTKILQKIIAFFLQYYFKYVCITPS